MHSSFGHAHDWAQAVAALSEQGKDFVIVTVLNKAGSAPRDAGTKMVVTDQQCYATIGGGKLELLAIETALKLLAEGKETQVFERFPLGAKTAQCCGGMVELLFEVMIVSEMKLDIYGAGHVSKALIKVLAELPVNIRLIDSREEMFPEHLPLNVKAVLTDDPVGEVATAPSDTVFLVMTHDHQLDLDICARVLKGDQRRWLGVIGSETKAKRFRYKLAQRGFSEDTVNSMHCPIGLEGTKGKRPMEIAVSVAAQLIQMYQSGDKQTQDHTVDDVITAE